MEYHGYHIKGIKRSKFTLIKVPHPMVTEKLPVMMKTVLVHQIN